MGDLKRAALGSNETAYKMLCVCAYFWIQAYYSVVFNTSFI